MPEASPAADELGGEASVSAAARVDSDSLRGGFGEDIGTHSVGGGLELNPRGKPPAHTRRRGLHPAELDFFHPLEPALVYLHRTHQ